jgi:hypothetical protein
MKLNLQYVGQVFRIYAIILDNGRCPVITFLEQLKRDNPASHRSLVLRFQRHADFGASHNKQQSRPITGRNNLFEFKSRQGDRILYFYLSGAKTVLIQGFHKGDPARSEFDKAENIRDQYLREEYGGHK